MLHFIPIENDTTPTDTDRTQEAVDLLWQALQGGYTTEYVKTHILAAIHILNKQRGKGIPSPCRTLSQLMGALGELLGGSGSVGEEELLQIGATPEERKILEDYGRANGPMPYVPPNAS